MSTPLLAACRLTCEHGNRVHARPEVHVALVDGLDDAVCRQDSLSSAGMGSRQRAAAKGQLPNCTAEQSGGRDLCGTPLPACSPHSAGQASACSIGGAGQADRAAAGRLLWCRAPVRAALSEVLTWQALQGSPIPIPDCLQAFVGVHQALQGTGGPGGRQLALPREGRQDEDGVLAVGHGSDKLSDQLHWPAAACNCESSRGLAGQPVAKGQGHFAAYVVTERSHLVHHPRQQPAVTGAANEQIEKRQRLRAFS